MEINEIFDENYIDLETVYNSILDGVVIANPSKNFLFWNDAAKEILEDEPGNDDPKAWAKRYRLYDPVTENFLEYDKLPMIRALNGEEYTDYRVMTKNISHPDGIILSVNGKPLRSGNATIGGITTFRDITKQLKQEKVIKTERNFYEGILDLMPGIVFIKDLEGKFIYGNKSFHELLGTKSVIGKSSDDYLIKTMAQEVYTHDKMVLGAGHAMEFEEKIFWHDGSKSTFRTTRFPYYSVEGDLIGVCAVAKDITKEIEANELLEKERDRSAQVSKLAAIGILSAEIAHEIKNPLTILQTTSDLLNFVMSEKEIDRKLVKEKLNVFNETIARMNKVASSLGNLSRDATLEKDSIFVIKDMLEEVKSLCSFKTRKLQLDVAIRGDDDLKMTSNRIQISEVLLNLLMNALDAVEKVRNPEVRVSFEQVQNDVVFKIFDNGSGVSEELREKIFEPFFTTKGFLSGTGLGLSISKKIVDKYNGELFYKDSEEGHCFVLKLPLN